MIRVLLQKVPTAFLKYPGRRRKRRAVGCKFERKRFDNRQQLPKNGPKNNSAKLNFELKCYFCSQLAYLTSLVDS